MTRWQDYFDFWIATVTAILAILGGVALASDLSLLALRLIVLMLSYGLAMMLIVRFLVRILGKHMRREGI